MNSTLASNNTWWTCASDYAVVTVVFPCLYSIVFLVSLTLNIMAAWVFFNVPTNSTFVVYLKSLVVADILMTLTIPVKVLYYVGVSPMDLSVAHCRYSLHVFYVSMYISITFLGLISVDRYLKIVWPFGEFAVQKIRVGQALSAAVWLVFSCLGIVAIILTNKPPPPFNNASELECTSLMSEHGLDMYRGFTYFAQVVFWCTLVLMVVCYSFISRTVYKSYKASRSSSSEEVNRKTKAKVFVVVAVFFVCFAPFHFQLIPYTLIQTLQNTASHSCEELITLQNAHYATVWLLSTNTCLDPLIYILLCKRFRTRLVATLSTRKPHPVAVPGHNGTPTAPGRLTHRFSQEATPLAARRT